MTTDWNIQPRARVCQGCQQPFADKAAYHTVLLEVDQQLRRLDLCAACWQQPAGAAARTQPGFISYWQGVFEAPPPAEPIQKQTAESLLRKLMELNDPRYLPASYILAVMLERKRLLKVKEQCVRDGRRVFVYEQAKTGDLFTIPDPELQLDQLEQVQRDVATLLEQGTLPSGATAPPQADQAAPGATASAETSAPAAAGSPSG